MSKVLFSLCFLSGLAIGVYKIELVGSEPKTDFSESFDFFERNESPGKIEIAKLGPSWPVQFESEAQLKAELRALFPQLNQDQILAIQDVFIDGLSPLRQRVKNQAASDAERTALGRRILASEWASLFPDLPSLLVEQLTQIWNFSAVRENQSWPGHILAGLYNYFYLKESLADFDSDPLVTMAFRWSNNFGSIWPEEMAEDLPLNEIAEIAYRARSSSIRVQKWEWSGDKKVRKFGRIHSADFVVQHPSEYELEKSRLAGTEPILRIAGLVYLQLSSAKRGQYCVLPAFGKAERNSKQDIRLYIEPSTQSAEVEVQTREQAEAFLHDELNRDIRWGEATLSLDKIKRKLVISYDEESIRNCRSRQTDRRSTVRLSRGEDPVGEILFSSIEDESSKVSAKVSTLFSRFKRGFGVECEKPEEISNYFAKTPEIHFEFATVRYWHSAFFRSGWKASQAVLLAPKQLSEAQDEYNSSLIFLYPDGQAFSFDVRL